MQAEQSNPSKPVGQSGWQNTFGLPTASLYVLLMFKEPKNSFICYLKPSVATEVSDRQQESIAAEEKNQADGSCPLIPCTESSGNNRA